MKKVKILAATVLAAFIMSSCIGSFKLTSGLYNWNSNIGSKFANEVVFLAFTIIPVYPVCVILDMFVLNTIEFWSDEEVLALNNGDVKQIEYNGTAYTLSKKRNSLKIEQTDNKNFYAELSYNRMKKSWQLKNDNSNSEIMQFLNNSKINIHLPNNKKQTFDLNEQGIAELNETFRNNND